ncbi:MAG TPA: polymer-forming cytoskeletal protein [Polyangiaceae bacterium]|nr:polymer-forming cytoskeletal protein [Polyangiaceae bacterium]
MANHVTVIGRTTRVRGRVTGAADLDVRGFVEGEIAVTGDVTVDSQGMVGSAIHGRRVVVRGAVKGDLLGDEAVLLEEGARVVGDIRAPRVAIAQGALVRGYVQTGEGNAPAVAAARPQPAARPAPAPQVSVVTPKAPAAVAPKPAAKGGPAPVPARAAQPPALPSAAQRRPPPPVVPALKKARGQIVKKKER